MCPARTSGGGRNNYCSDRTMDPSSNAGVNQRRMAMLAAARRSSTTTRTPPKVSAMAVVDSGFIGAHRTFRQRRDTEEAKAAFLAIVDKGSISLKAAMAGTPYA